MNQNTGQFICSVEASKDLLQHLLSHLDNFLQVDLDQVSRSDVGDVQHVEQTLDTLLQWIVGEGESVSGTNPNVSDAVLDAEFWKDEAARLDAKLTSALNQLDQHGQAE